MLCLSGQRTEAKPAALVDSNDATKLSTALDDASFQSDGTSWGETLSKGWNDPPRQRTRLRLPSDRS